MKGEGKWKSEKEREERENLKQGERKGETKGTIRERKEKVRQ